MFEWKVPANALCLAYLEFPLGWTFQLCFKVHVVVTAHGIRDNSISWKKRRRTKFGGSHGPGGIRATWKSAWSRNTQYCGWSLAIARAQISGGHTQTRHFANTNDGLWPVLVHSAHSMCYSISESFTAWPSTLQARHTRGRTCKLSVRVGRSENWRLAERKAG